MIREYFKRTCCCALALILPLAANAQVSSSDTDLALLGNNVLSAIAGNGPLTDAASVFTARSGSWTYAIAGGADSSVDTETLTRIAAKAATIWRRTGAPGHETDFSITADGVFKTRITDPDHKLVFEYSPGEPELLNGVVPGEKRQLTYTVRATKLSAPDQTQVSGTLSVEFTYLGKYRINTGAGPIESHGFRKILTGQIGPTDVNTTLYVFYAAGIGEVARIDHTDVHALLVYNRDSRAAYLLKALPTFTGP